MFTIIHRIKHHFSNPESRHRQIALGLLWVGLFAFVSKLAGAAKEIAVAWRYGISETVDAYVFLFNLVTWPVTVWFSILTVVLIPLVARVQISKKSELPRFQRELLALTIGMGILIGGIFWAGLPRIIELGVLGLSGGERQVALEMVGPMTILLPLGVVTGLCSTWLMVSGSHRNTLLEAMPALAILFVLLLPLGTVPEPLVWGTLIGALLQLMILVFLLRKMGSIRTPSFSFESSIWFDFRNAFGLMAIGQVLMSFTSLVDQIFAAHIESGALSTLNYANRILALALSLLAISVARAILPVLADSRAKGERFSDAYGVRWAILIFILGSVLSALIWVSSGWIVSVLFERGAFTAENTTEVAELLRFMALQIPFFGFSVALAQVLTSGGRWDILLISGIIGICVKVISALILIPILSTKGLAISNMFVYLFNSLFFIHIIKQRSIK